MSQTDGGASPAPPPSHILPLANGQQIDLTTGKVVSAVPVRRREASPSVDGPSRIVARRSLADLPVSGPQMRVMAAAAALALWGLQPGEIAEVFGIEQARIDELQEQSVYKNFLKALMSSVLESEMEEVRDHIGKASRIAADRVMSILDDPDASSITVLKAAQDLLDRGGLRAADIVEHRHSVQGGLKIIYEKRASNLEGVKDITFSEIKDG